MRSTLLFTFLLTVSIFNNGFSQNDIDLNSLPPVEELMVIRTNPSADTVIIGMHGGPTDALDEGQFEYFEAIPTFSVVEVKQYQHHYPATLDNSALTLDEAIIMMDTTVAMMRKVVNHFNNMNKTVVIIGHSFGAFLLSEYLDDYGIDDVHRAIPMSGRLNMNQEVIDAVINGYWVQFIKGITVSIDTLQADPESWATFKLVAGVGYNRYVDSLVNMDLSKLMYVYGKVDGVVGRLLPEEITMLENTNAAIVGVENGDHFSPFDIPQMTQMLEFIREDQMVGIYESAYFLADVKIYPTIADSYLTIDAANTGKLRIIAVNGQIMHQENCSSGKNNVFVNNLPTGQYVAQYITTDNRMRIQKIIIH